MDPVTALAALAISAPVPYYFITTVFGGWLGNRGDHYACKVSKAVYERLKNQSAPTNHDIQRAVRGAYLRATLMVCQRLIAEKSNVIHRFLIYPTLDIKKVVTYLNEQLHHLSDIAIDLPGSTATIQYELLLEPRGETASQRVNELKQQLRESILTELATAKLHVEDDLKTAILTGFMDGSKRVDWYELMCGFFAEELKTNQRLSTITETNLLLEQKNLLVDLKKQLPDIDWPDELLQKQTERISEATQPLIEQHETLMSKLGEMLDLLVDLKTDIAQVQKTVEAGNDANRTLLLQVLSEITELRPQKSTRHKYLNTFARYDLQNLIGREKQLQAIDTHLAKHNLLLLRGMGGIGKTTLARAYLARMEAEFDHIAFVEITGTIADGMLLTLGASTDVDFTPDPAKDTEAKFSDLIGVLRHIPNTLLVIDNANDADDLLYCKKAFDSLPWKVLITSRARVHTYQQEHKVQEIKHLMPDEALALFEKLYDLSLTNVEIEMVTAILEKAFYHPKLIEVLAKAARENPLLELTTLQDIVENKDYGDDEINYPVEVGDEEKPVYRILLDLFDTGQLSEEAQQLLRYFSVLPTIDIPFKHLTELLKAEEASARKSLLENLKKLTRTGWLDDIDNRYFSMHGLLKWVVSERLQPTSENCADLSNRIIDLFKRSVELDIFNAEQYIPYGYSISDALGGRAGFEVWWSMGRFIMMNKEAR